MPSEMEQALDEILSGVTTLLQKGPVQAPSRAPSRFSSVDAFEVGVQESESHELLAILALIDSDPSHRARQAAGRRIQRLLSSRLVRLGDFAGAFSQVGVSPMILPQLIRLAKAGGVLVECDAERTHWDLSALSTTEISGALNQFSATLCLNQNSTQTRWSLPRIPERLRVALKSRSEFPFIQPFEGHPEFAMLDQDNAKLETVTILWIAPSMFVPDWWCGMAAINGAWVPVVRPSTRK